MPEVVIKYKKPETLKILKGLAKYFDFKVSETKNAESLRDILIKGDKNLSITELEEIFTGSNIDAKKLRQEAWKRKA